MQPITTEILNELVACKVRADDMRGAFNEALKAQAEKHGLTPKALRAAVAAIAKRNSDEVKTTADEVITILSLASGDVPHVPDSE